MKNNLKINLDKTGLADGRIRAKNPSAFWLPDLTISRKIGGTLYTVTGSCEGTERLDRKLLRVMSQNFESMEDTE